MSLRSCLRWLVAVSVLLSGVAVWPGEIHAAQAPASVAVDAHDRVRAALQGLPLMFVEQDEATHGHGFLVHGGDRRIWLDEASIRVTVREPQSRLSPTEDGALYPAHHPAEGLGEEVRAVSLNLSFVDANPHPRLQPVGRLETRVNYFLGNDPEKWRTNLPVWTGVRYEALYPGVDLEIDGSGGRWSWRLVTDTPARLEQVRLRVEGAETVALEGAGVRLSTAVGAFTMPLLEVAGERAGEPRVESLAAQVADIHAPYADAAIPASDVEAQNDNPLLYATFLGGGNIDGGTAVAVDGSGAAYVAGGTFSDNFPTTPGAFSTTYHGQSDAIVVKLNATGSALVYATFLGGSNMEWGHAIAVDGSGAAYVTGTTSSTDFPTREAVDPTYNGDLFDAYVVKLKADGSDLVYATYLGGDGEDRGWDIAADGSGAAYVTGDTDSSNFPTTEGAYNRIRKGTMDAFVVKMNPTGSTLAYGTLVGGSGSQNTGTAIAVDASGVAYVTGATLSANFPTTDGVFQENYQENGDVVVFKLNATGSNLLYSTYVGGSSLDWSFAVAVDGSGAAYVTGYTASTNFPTTEGAFSRDHKGSDDAFVFQLNPTASALVYATFLGGTEQDWSYGIAVDASGSAYVAGMTRSPDFPTTPKAYDTSYNGGDSDAFVVKLNADGSAPLTYATFLGGEKTDDGRGIAVDGHGAAHVTGNTSSANFPTTPGAFSTSYNGGPFDAFVVKLLYLKYLPLIRK